MVQLTNAFVAAAIIVPALSAPIIETREPKGALKNIVKIGGNVASGASLGLTVGGLLQSREEIEIREPKVSSSQVQSIVSGVTSAAKNAKSGIEFGAAVAPLFPHSRRSFGDVDALEAREPFRVSGSVIRKADSAVASAAGSAGTATASNSQKRRNFDDSIETRQFRGGRPSGFRMRPIIGREDIESREPFKVSGGTLRKVGGAIGGAAGFSGTVAALNTQQKRDLETREPFGFQGPMRHMPVIGREDIEARSPFKISSSALRKGGSALAGAAGFAGTVAALNTQQQRDFNDMEAREPLNFGGIIKGVESVVKNVLRDESGSLEAREPEPGFNGLTRGGVSFVKNVIRDDGEMVEARGPFNIGGVIRGVENVVKNVLREDDGEEFFMRESLNVDELD